MKGLRTFFTVVLSMFAAIAYADNEKPIKVTQMPQTAQQFIKQHFAGSKILLAKEEFDFPQKSYEVIFENGNQIEFDSKGNWKEIDCGRSGVPAAAVPSPIMQYVKSNHPDAKIVKIERDRKEYEVKLSNRMEITFDTKFNVIDIDY